MQALMQTMTELVKKTSSPGRDRVEGEDGEDVSETVRGGEKGDLSPLKEPSVKDGALNCGLWLEWMKLDVPPLSKTAGEYWMKVMAVVQAKYAEWQTADLMVKHGLKISEDERVLEPKWDRLQARLAKLLLKAIPKSVSDECVTQRLMTVESVLFYVLKRYQPGGVAEKSSLLQAVEKVGKHTTARGLSDEIISWRLKMSRVEELGIVPPDSSRLIDEWLKASDDLLKKLGNDSMIFRMQAVRMGLYLDTHPSQESLEKYLVTLQAELANIALAEPSTALTINQLNTKGPQQQKGAGQQQAKGSWGTPSQQKVGGKPKQEHVLST